MRGLVRSLGRDASATPEYRFSAYARVVCKGFWFAGDKPAALVIIFEVPDGNRMEVLAFGRRGGRWGDIVQPTYDADHWRRLAEGARATAGKMTDAEARQEMRIIALAYERLADHAERTAGRRAARKSC